MARVLVQGIPFTVGNAAIHRYAGPHEIRWMCGLPHAADWGYHLRYDLLEHDTDALLERLGEWVRDLILFFQPEDQPPPRGIEHCPIKTAAVPADWSHTFPRIHGAIGKFDVAAFDRPGAEAADWRGHVDARCFGPVFSYAPSRHRILGMERDIDVLYCGSMNHALRPERGVLLPRLEAMRDRYRIEITSGVYDEDYVRLMNRAKLVFNYSARGELNLRVFETLACGCVPMLERSNSGAAHEFTDGEDIVLFDLDDFEERIDTVLSDESALRNMLDRCAARAKDYAPEVLLNRIIDGALDAPSSGRHYRDLPEQEQHYFDLMAHSGSSFPEVQRRESDLVAAYVDRYPNDPRAMTVLARQLLTPVLHLFMECPDEAQRMPVVRKALQAAAQLAPEDAVFQANAFWACRWCEDFGAAQRYASRALEADRIAYPELLVGSLEDPAWGRYMLAAARGEALEARLSDYVLAEPPR